MQLDLFDLARRPFLDAAQEIAGSLVYLDAGAGEVAASSLGLPFLLGEASRVHLPLSSPHHGLHAHTPCLHAHEQGSAPSTSAP